jgi:hypothetical protein
MYKDFIISCKLERESISISYNTGVQQGDNASPVLFAYVIQAFLDTLTATVKAPEYQSFKSPENGNLNALNNHLVGKPM